MAASLSRVVGALALLGAARAVLTLGGRRVKLHKVLGPAAATRVDTSVETAPGEGAAHALDAESVHCLAGSGGTGPGRLSGGDGRRGAGQAGEGVGTGTTVAGLGRD